MTTTRYLMARLAMAFGIDRQQRRMADAAAESHLLREAEQLLGKRVWENVEDVEELGIEYWNLRRLFTERKQLRDKLEESESILASAHDQRAGVLGEKSAEHDEYETRRKEVHMQLEVMARDRDQIVNEARDIRRIYDGLKTKLEVLKEEERADDDTVEKTSSRMVELKKDFDRLKINRDKVAENIKRLDAELDEIESHLEAERKKHRQDAADAFQQIGDANRSISEYKAELGLIETRMQQLFAEIGRHVSRNSHLNAECREASKDFSSMVEVMAQLRKSITLNHKLTES